MRHIWNRDQAIFDRYKMSYSYLVGYKVWTKLSGIQNQLNRLLNQIGDSRLRREEIMSDL
jgi:hypothetical protein